MWLEPKQQKTNPSSGRPSSARVTASGSGRFELQHRTQAFKRLFKAAERLQDAGAIVPGIRDAGMEMNQRIQAFQSVLPALELN